MLQPHQIIAEYNSAIPEAEREKLKDGAFEDVLRAAQVCIRFRISDLTSLHYSLLVYVPALTSMLSYLTGSNCYPPMGCTRHSPQAWCLGVCEGQCE